MKDSLVKLELGKNPSREHKCYNVNCAFAAHCVSVLPDKHGISVEIASISSVQECEINNWVSTVDCQSWFSLQYK